MAYHLTSSSERMKNYVQAEIMSPEHKFEAVQTSTGLSILFSIGTDNTFYVTEETHGTSSAGWIKHTLQTNCKTFAVAQDHTTGTISVAMVVNHGGNDILYLSLGNSNSSTYWLQNIVWKAYSCDLIQKPTSINIVNVFLSETNTGQYIEVDVERDPTSPTKLVSRYYIDLSPTDGHYWHSSNINIDLDATSYQSRLGRKAGQSIDGLYTMGQIDGSPQFIYQPLYNIFDLNQPSPPSPLHLPNGLRAESIATSRNSDHTTDLFCTSGTGLYYFASTNQHSNATGQLLFQNDHFLGTHYLFAYQTNSSVFIWGLNQADQVVYTHCPLGQVTIPSAWAVPIPILSSVDLVSPYVNHVDDGSTFFAVGGNDMFKMIQSPTTSIWKKQHITLPTPNVQTTPQSFSSYTTHVQLIDEKDQAPAQPMQVLLSANTRGHFYINNLYYVLDENPIAVPTNKMGSITIIEPIGDVVQGTRVTASLAGVVTKINPMDKAIHKLTGLNSADKLKNAVVTNPINGSTQPLIPYGVSTQNLTTLAQRNQTLATAYNQLVSRENLEVKTSIKLSEDNFGGSILTDIGNIFSWLESGIEHAIQVVYDSAKGFWKFVVTIANKTYEGILDAVEKVAGAIKWIYKAIRTAIQDLIKFIEFLFEWEDITRTKKVLKNLLKLYLQHEIGQIEDVKQLLDQNIDQLISTINNWSGVGSMSGLGNAANNPVTASSKTKSNNPAHNLLAHHLQHNIVNAISPNSSAQNPSSAVQTLFNAIQEEGHIFDSVLDELKQLADNYLNMSLEDIIKRVIGILADGVLESTKNVMDALFDILYEICETALNAFNTNIHIPVVSSILQDFGISSFSLLDIACWIAAVPATLAYKVTHSAVLAENVIYPAGPFPKNGNTLFLTNTPSFNTLIEGFNSLPQQTKDTVFEVGHTVQGLIEWISTYVSALEAEAMTGENPFSKPSAVLGILSAGIGGITDVLVPKAPIKSKPFAWTNKVTTGLVVISKIIFSGPGQKYFASKSKLMSKLKVNNGRATGAIVNSILIIPALACSCWHFYELSQISDSTARTKAIIGETANMTSYIRRVGYAFAVADSEEFSKNITIGIMTIASICTASLHIAEGVVE